MSLLENSNEIRKYFRGMLERSEKAARKNMEMGLLVDPPPLYLPFSSRAARVALRKLLKYSTGKERSFYSDTLSSLEDDSRDE